MSAAHFCTCSLQNCVKIKILKNEKWKKLKKRQSSFSSDPTLFSILWITGSHRIPLLSTWQNLEAAETTSGSPNNEEPVFRWFA